MPAFAFIEPLVLTRARAFVGRGRFLQGAGGRDPRAPGPEGARGARVGCDGPGFIAWCLGYDRYQPGFAGGWDWVEPDSMIAEAELLARWFQPLDEPETGGLIVYPSIELQHAGRVDRRGHVGLVAAVPERWPRGDARWAELRVIHCAASLQRRHGYAIGETHAVAWSSRASFQGQSHPHWRTRFLRYVRDLHQLP
ncbi:MAG: hypothetical protein R3B48_25455 [Kofleriaceae bacterium]